jgi:hypothetical protein
LFLQACVLQACSTECLGLRGLPVFVSRTWLDDDLCEDEPCDDELWLPLDFAPAGAAASVAAIMATDKDKASFGFSIVIPRIRIAEE